MTGDRRSLPPELERLIVEVVEAADLDMLDGRDEVERELRSHFEDGLADGRSVDELVSRFGDPAAAGRRIGRSRPRAAARNRGDSGRWWMSLSDVYSEVRRAARRLGRAPAFSLIVVVTLALGVGANTAVFTVLNAVMLDDLPYHEPDRLVRVYEANEENPTTQGFLRVPIVREYRSWDDVFESVAAIYTYREVGADLTDGDQPVRVTMLRVSSGYFETLGVAPALGRAFDESESYGVGESGGSRDLIARVAMISSRLWRDHFGADPEILGRTVRLDGFPFEVIGVVPDGFTNPFGAQGDVWIPQDMRMGGSNSFNNWYLSAVARLRDGVSREQAAERAAARSAAFNEGQPDAYGQRAFIVPLQEDVVGATRATMLWALAVAAALVLLTACLNVANLLLARGLAQGRGLALRSALGSGRSRLVAALLVESGLLALAGGVAGLLVGWTGIRGLMRIAPNALPGTVTVEMGTTVFVFTLLITTFALLGFGLVPALRLSKTTPATVLRSGDRSATVGRRLRRVRDGLVALQVAAALVLVSGAALLSRSFSQLTDVPLGVEPSGLMTFEVHLPEARYASGEERHNFHDRFQDRVRELPNVAAIGATSWLPLQGRYHQWGFGWDASNAEGDEGAWHETDVRVVAGDYFEAMDIELLRGSAPDDIDYGAEFVVWINRTIAEQVFGNTDPLGLLVDMQGEQRRVVGIVADVPFGARGETSRKVYLPHAQFHSDRNWALIQTVRASGDLPSLRSSISEILAELDGQLVLYRPQTFDSVVSEQRAQDRFATVLMSAFAGLALLLALLGTYGVLAGSVAGRTREIGIRMALGADGESIRRMVLRYGLAVTVPGIALGLVGALVGSRWIEVLLFGVDPGDPAAYALAIVTFLLFALFSAWLPARRATRVDAVETLTAD